MTPPAAVRLSPPLEVGPHQRGDRDAGKDAFHDQHGRGGHEAYDAAIRARSPKRRILAV